MPTAFIDFTVPAATIANVAIAAERRLVHIIGTTGLSAVRRCRDRRASRASAVIVQSGNMSLGVNLLAALVKRVAQSLDEELRHRNRRNAPQGPRSTRRPAPRSCSAKPPPPAAASICTPHSERGRDGHTGARQPGDIGFASVRGGTVVGEHSVIFAGPAERIELTHRAEDRMIFARGAVKAALWAHGRKPGLYTMTDVLGLEDF